MENLKVKVNNEAESKEVHGLFFELGYNFSMVDFCKYYNSVQVFNDGSGSLFEDHDACSHKEITLPQLHDMVVLKRNNVADATHVNLVTGSEVLQQGDKNYYWQLGEWHLYPCGVDIKPIKEKEMKEFLVNHDGKWTLQLLDADTEENSYRVAVPSGENVAYKDDDGSIYFTRVEMGYRDVELIWQRHTPPEELPFIDDEPKSLNDTYAEIEQVRQHNHYFKDVSDIEQMDVYEVLKRFEVTDPCLQHIVKKALCAGQRGHKDFKKDLQDILDTAVRAVDINK